MFHPAFFCYLRPKPFQTMSQVFVDSLSLENEVVLTVTPRTASGAVATVDGVPSWSAEEGVVTLLPSEDGLSCVVSADTAGSFKVVCKADADLDADEVREISVEFVGLFTPVEAESLAGTFTIQPKA